MSGISEMMGCGTLINMPYCGAALVYNQTTRTATEIIKPSDVKVYHKLTQGVKAIKERDFCGFMVF